MGRVKFSGGRECSGHLKGFDQLLNIVLDNCIEYLRDPDDPYKLTEDTRVLGLVVCRGIKKKYRPFYSHRNNQTYIIDQLSSYQPEFLFLCSKSRFDLTSHHGMIIIIHISQICEFEIG